MVIIIPPLSPGEHNITTEYSGDDKYVPTTNTTTVVSRVGIDNMTVVIPNNVNNVTNTNITVENLPKDATGNVTVNIDGKNYTGEVKNGTVVIIIPPLAPGEHNITTTYPGDDKYAPATNTTSVVSKVGIENMTVIIPDTINNVTSSNITVTNLPKDASGNVTVTVDGKNYTGEVKNGTAIITIPPLTPGNHNITTTYEGDDKYAPTTNTTSVISKVGIDNMTVIPSDNLNDVDNGTITVELPKDATGNVTINIDGKNYTGEVENGTVIITIPPLSPGNHNITTTYSGDDKYAPMSKNSTVVSKQDINSNVTVDIPESMTHGENSTITIDLPEDATGNVTISIDGKNYTGIVVNGSVNISIPALDTGNYTIITYYSGDDNYTSFTKETNVTVVKNSFILTTEDVVMFYKDGSKWFARLTDLNGNPIANQSVSFTINGVTYNKVTDINGTALLSINLNSGVYTGVVSARNISKNVTITVNSTIEGNGIVKMYQNGTQFYATFYGANDEVLANTNVTFNINGVLYTRQTNVNGTAKLNINLNPGNYTLTAYNSFNDEENSFDIVVKSLIETNDLSKYYKNASQFEAKVYNSDGSVGANKTVTFNINGVFYNRVADSNGIVKLNINLRPGEYIITTIYEGLEVGNKVSVLSTLETNDLSMTFQDGSNFTVKTLDGQGMPLPNQNLTFNIHGVFYHKTTDDNGVSNLNINLMKGEYIITSMWDDYEIANMIYIS